jgi:predicted Zn-dependent peptidase
MVVSNEIDNRLEIELLKKDVSVVTALLGKFDTTIEKMQEIATSLSRMVSLQEQRIETQEEVTREVQSVLEMRRLEHNADIKDLHSRITTVNRELTEKIADTENKILEELKALREEIKKEKTSVASKISQIEMWKWMVMGAIALAGWLFGQAINIAKLFG